MTTIRDVFDLPTRDEITAQSFVIKLESQSEPAARKKIVDDYVMTPAVREALPGVFDGLRHAYERQGHLEVGRFIHGSFGSGKSHFLSLIALLLENDDAAWTKVVNAIPALADHRAWIAGARVLPVRIHMLSADRPGFDLVILSETNRELRMRDKAELVRFDVQQVFDEAFRLAERFGDAFFRDLQARGVVESRAELEEIANGSEKERDELARLLVESGGVTPGAASALNWSESLQALTTHVKAQGFGALVFLVDEMLLWLSEKEAHEFKRAINQLTAIVDHADGARALPVAVFVARQRALSEFFPDLVADAEMHEHLDHHSKRFEVTNLEDVELRYVCKERVLRKKDPVAVQKAVEDLIARRGAAVREAQQNADTDYVRDVYPFHPALVEMIIDVSSLLQRERTALRLLYELLVVHYPELPLGELLPVGSAFEAIFPRAGIEGTKRIQDLKKIHQLYWDRFRPAVAQMLVDKEIDEPQAKVLDQLVKTALLAEISPRLKTTGGMTVARLVRLNEVDVPGTMDRGRMNLARQNLLALARRVPVLKLAGENQNTVVGVEISGADLSEYFDRARAAVKGVEPKRFAVFYRTLKKVLGLTELNGFGDGEGNDGTRKIIWRGTKRALRVRFANVRELRNADLKHAEADCQIIIDYPWDSHGFTVDHDRHKVEEARRREGATFTACWLPRHFDPNELAQLEDLAAIEHLIATEAQLLANLGPGDRQTVVDQARLLREQIASRLEEVISSVYKAHGQIVAMLGGVPTTPPHPDADLDGVLEALAMDLLDRRWPQHPNFDKVRELREADLVVVCDWLVEASDAGGEQHPYDVTTQGKLLKSIGGPLDLLELGEVRGRLRRDTRYLKAVLDRASGPRVTWDPIDQVLETEFGFNGLLRSFFLTYVSRAWGYRVLDDRGDVMTPKIATKIPPKVVLERAPLLEPAEWARIRDLLGKLLGAALSPAHRSVSEQDKLLVDAQKQLGEARRRSLRELHELLVGLGAGESTRTRELADAIRRLAPLAATSTDSHGVLRELLAQWPDDATGARDAVRTADAVRDAVRAVESNVVEVLRHATEHAELGTEVQGALGELNMLLGAGTAAALSRSAVDAWNGRARDLMRKLVSRPVPPREQPPLPPLPEPPRKPLSQPPRPPEVQMLCEDRVVDLDDSTSVAEFLEDLRHKMRAIGGRGVPVTVIAKAPKRKA